MNESKRYITVEGKAVPLGIYVAGIKKAIANPEAVFPHGLTCWWPATGAEIRRQFMQSVNDRINQGVPYYRRGLA